MIQQTLDTVLIIFILVINLVAYVSVYLMWRYDCRDIGRERLAVPLGERMRAVFSNGNTAVHCWAIVEVS